MVSLDELAEHYAKLSLKDIIMGYLLADLGASNLIILEKRLKKVFPKVGPRPVDLTPNLFKFAIMELQSEGKLTFLSPNHVRLSSTYLKKIEGII